MIKRRNKTAQSSSYTHPFVYQTDRETDVRVRVGVIGCGYWGPNLIRNFNDLPNSKVSAVCDLKLDRLKPIQRKYPGIKFAANYDSVLKYPAVDAVVIVTPIKTHYAIAASALKAGKHVLVEKPLAATAKQCEALMKLARKYGKVLMVGHTFEYHPAVLKISDLLASGELGDIHYIDSTRVNLGLYQSDGLNVIWDLAPHDVSIILRWLKRMPQSVSAWGRPFVRNGIHDVAFIRLEFPGAILAHLQVSWLSPAKIRRMTIVGNKKMIIYDDLENVEKIKIADRGASLDQSDVQVRVAYRIGDIISPCVPSTEALSTECAHFIECVLRDKSPVTDGQSGLNVVRILEAADKSIKRNGVTVRL